MTCAPTVLRQKQRHWGWFKLAAVAAVVFLGIVLLLGLYYRFHLHWQYEAGRLGLHEVQAIPDHPMPDSPTPNSWLQCHVGCIEFSLPAELASNRTGQNGDESLVTFQHGSRVVVVAVPAGSSESLELLKTASELCPWTQQFTMPELRRTCYQVSSNDFRWSMAPSEVRWHAFCVTTSKLIRPQSGGYTESFFREDLDGIVHFHNERAQLDWQTKDRKWGGYMHFSDRNENSDPTWIRAACQSLKVSTDAATSAPVR
jgi:hypothetical protein